MLFQTNPKRPLLEKTYQAGMRAIAMGTNHIQQTQFSPSQIATLIQKENLHG
jgi:hypothetical protein